MRCGDWLPMLASAVFFAGGAICEAPAAPAVAQSGAGGSGVICRIDVSHPDGLLDLRAIGRSEIAVSGGYEFSIDKRNAAGSTVNQQSGSFELTPGEDTVLATVMLEAAAQGHYSADLILNWSGGTTSCRSP